MAFLTPFWEMKLAPQDKFLSLTYAPGQDSGSPISYRYVDSTKNALKVNMPSKGFKRIVLATTEGGEIIYMDETGKISKENKPLGI